MKHIMHLKKIPFQKIYNGEKTIELRLYDEKRQQVSVGDEIRFVYDENEHIFMKCKVTDIHRFSSFEELYEKLPLEKFGYKDFFYIEDDEFLEELKAALQVNEE